MAAAGSVLGALTKCSLWERLWLIFRVRLQQGESAPGSRVDGEQGLISSRQFWIFDGLLGVLQGYLLVLVGCEGGSLNPGFSCVVLCFGIVYPHVLEGCGGGLVQEGDFDFDVIELLVAVCWSTASSPRTWATLTPLPATLLIREAALKQCWWCRRPAWPLGLRGVRVGEASRPGPGGGAAATSNRRHERKVQQALVAIIEMLVAMVGGIAGADHPARAQMAGIRTLLEVLREEPEEDHIEGEYQQPPWRSVTFDDEPAVQTFEASGPLRQLPAKLDGGKGGKADKGKAKGSDTRGDGQGKGAKGGGDGKKTPSKGKRLEDKGGAGQRVSGRFRQQDWQGTVMDYDKVCAQLNSLSGSVVVPVADAEQADALSQMLLGAGSRCTARLLWPDKDGGVTAPVVTAEGVLVQTFAHRDYVTAGTALPSIKGAPSATFEGFALYGHVRDEDRLRQGPHFQGGVERGRAGTQGSCAEVGQGYLSGRFRHDGEGRLGLRERGPSWT